MSKILYFSHGRTALKYGLKFLKLNEGDKILIPEFICSVIIDPIIKLGLKIVYYSVEKSLEPKWKEINSFNEPEIKAILMVHYFGFTQNINKFQEISKKKSWHLIEDNAHGFGGKFNGNLLGTFGDIGISSPWKYSNLLSGGILYLNKKINYKVPNNLKRFKPSIFLFLLKFILGKNFVKTYLKKSFFDRPDFENPYSFYEKPITDKKIDKLSYKLLKNKDWSKMAFNRRINYNSWLDFFKENKKVTPVFNFLSEECSPLCYPIYVKDKKTAIKWFEWGWDNGYYVYSWPNLPIDKIKEKGNALEIWETLICFSTEKKFVS